MSFAKGAARYTKQYTEAQIYELEKQVPNSYMLYEQALYELDSMTLVTRGRYLRELHWIYMPERTVFPIGDYAPRNKALVWLFRHDLIMQIRNQHKWFRINESGIAVLKQYALEWGWRI